MTVSALDDKHSADQLGHRIGQFVRQYSPAARTTHLKFTILFSKRRSYAPRMLIGSAHYNMQEANLHKGSDGQ